MTLLTFLCQLISTTTFILMCHLILSKRLPRKITSGGGVGYLGHRLSLQHAATRGTGSIYGSLYPSVSHHQRAADQQGHQ